MIQKSLARKRNSSDRFDRESWLLAGLEVASRAGGARLTIRGLAEQLGVTTGSFYWHFRDRREFVRSLVEYWDVAFTETPIRLAEQETEEPCAQLLSLMSILTEGNYGRYEVPVRAWAAQDVDVAKVVRKVDRRRVNKLRRLFEAMGFAEPEADMRARTFVVFHALELSMYAKQGKKQRLEAVARRHALLTRQ
jgi:AcrR family transcriptional regulator